MKFTLTIECDNEAFNTPTGTIGLEVARILRKLADGEPMPADGPYKLRDINGNTVGKAEFLAS